jgi:Transposase, Mutator family
VLVAALGIDGEGHKHPLALIEGATENAAVVQALIDNLIERGLDPKVCRLFIIDGAKALSKVIRRTFGVHTPIQRCQIHRARNVIERLPKPLHASTSTKSGAPPDAKLMPWVTPFRRSLLQLCRCSDPGVRHFRASENQQEREPGTGFPSKGRNRPT